MKKIKLDLNNNMKESDRLKSAFVGASEAGDEKMVEIMLPWVLRNDVNCTDRMGVTALMAALAKDQYEVCGTLLDLPGLDFSMRDSQGKTLLDHLLKSKSLFYLDEIVEEMEVILSPGDLNDILLKKLTECMPELMDNITMFKRVLPYYNINYKNGELLNCAMKLAGDLTVLAFITIYEEEISQKMTEDNLSAVASAVAAGHTALIGLLLPSHELVDMKELLSLCRKNGVKKEVINQELLKSLCGLMLVIKDEIIYDHGLKFLDINSQDEKGETILMKILQNVDNLTFGFDGLKIVRKILTMKELDLNIMSENGETVLDFLQLNDNYHLKRGLSWYWMKDKVEKSMVKVLGSQDSVQLFPVVNLITRKSNSVKIMKTLALDVQLLNQFKVRQDSFKDVDFNFVKHTLLSRAMKACRLDLVRFLIINCSVKLLQCDLEVWGWLCSLEIADRHWCEVRDSLSTVLEKIVQEELEDVKG